MQERPDIVSRTREAAAFTLVELLVVIGIIALLISILLPSLNRARRAANTIKCAANLHSMMEAVQIYVSQNKGWLPGSPMTTGGFMFNRDGSEASDNTGTMYSDTNCPNIIQCDDFLSPLADMMNIKFDHGASMASRLSRFLQLTSAGVFTCPQNNFLSTYYSGFSGASPAAPTIIMPSYNSNLNLLLPYCGYYTGTTTSFTTSTKGVQSGNMQYSTATDGSYVPKISRVGDTSKKILFADGARYANGQSGGGPDYSAGAYGAGGGFCGTVGGACQAASNSFDRRGAPANHSSYTGETFDGRLYWARHGSTKQFLSPDSYRANAAFVDGHVETLGDLAIADPNFWFPRGFVVQTTGGGAFGADVLAQYLNPSTTTFVAGD